MGVMVFRFRAPLYVEGSEISEIAMGTDKAKEVAQAIFAKAQELAKADGEDDFAESLQLVEGSRPKGRAYLRIIADDENGEKVEFGDTNSARRRILGRAAGVNIFNDGKN